MGGAAKESQSGMAPLKVFMTFIAKTIAGNGARFSRIVKIHFTSAFQLSRRHSSPSSQNAPSFHFHFLDNVLLLIKTGIGDLSQRLLHSRGRSRRDWFPVPAMHASAADRLSLLRPTSASPKPQHTPTQSCTNATRLHKIHKNPR